MKEQTNRVEQYTTRNQWITEAEKWLNNLEDEMVKIIAAEQNIEKRMKKNWRCPWDLFFLLFSCSIVSDTLWLHGLQHTRLPCPSPTPGACSNSCPLSWWCHPMISSSVVPTSCLKSFPESGFFQMSQLFASGSQSTGASAYSCQWIFRVDFL